MRNSNYRTFFSTFSALIIAVVIVNLLTFIIVQNNSFHPTFTERRGQAIISNVEVIRKSKNPVLLMFGASDMEAGFHPVEFDSIHNQKHEPLKSYNVAVRSIDPEGLEILTERLSREFQSRNEKVQVSILPLSLLRMTVKNEKTGASKGILYNFNSTLSSFDMLSDELRISPENAMARFTNKVVFGNRDPGLIGKFIFYQVGGRDNFPAYRLPWSDPEFQEEQAWNPEARGFFFFNHLKRGQKLEKIMQKASEEKSLRSMIADFDKCCDLLGLKFDQKAIERFIRAARSMKKVSLQVYFLIPPEPPLLRTTASLERQANIDEMLSRISSETGFKVIDFRKYHDQFVSEDYWDIFHFTSQGRQKFNSILSQEISVITKSNED